MEKLILLLLGLFFGFYFGHYYGRDIYRFFRFWYLKFLRWKRGSNKPKDVRTQI